MAERGAGKFFALMKAQPVSGQLFGRLILNAPTGQIIETCICGLTVEVAALGDDAGTVTAQAVVAAFEAMLATMIEDGVGPHTERFRVDIVETDEPEPSVRTDPKAMRSLVAWPRSSRFLISHVSRMSGRS